MSGTAAVPNVFATQAGTVPASQLDGNWNAVTAYINDREVSSGTLAARSATPTAGLWYFANDDNGGTLYFGNGTSWIPATVGLSSGVIVPVPISQGGTGSTSLAAGVIKSNATLLFSSSTLDVPSGGTGSVTWQSHAVLLGNGAAPFGQVGLATSGSLLVGQAAAAPVALAVGADSATLYADSTRSQGVRWGVGPKARLGFCQAGTQAAGDTHFWGPWASSASEAEAFNRHYVPYNGTLRNLFVYLTTAPGAGSNVPCTIRVNGVSTTIQAIVTNANGGFAADSSNLVSVRAGQYVTLQVTYPAGVSPTGTAAVEIDPS